MNPLTSVSVSALVVTLSLSVTFLLVAAAWQHGGEAVVAWASFCLAMLLVLNAHAGQWVAVWFWLIVLTVHTIVITFQKK
ncbi:MAG: hypothetical protein AAB548_00125 [Patescibacteria group bacterium]